MRVVIAGAGHAGLSVAAYLFSCGHDVVVVDRDAAAARQAFEEYGLVALAGDATSAKLLAEAEVARADVVVAMLRRDADNLAVALLARAAGAKRVMVRMRQVEYRSVYLAAGVDRILAETDVLIGALATAIEHEEVRHSMVLGAGESIAVELLLPDDAIVAGSTVSEIAASAGFPGSCVFAAISTGGGPMTAPRGGAVIAGGAHVLLVLRRGDLGAALEFFTRRRPA
jgi:trk system potassium uptake protein TrkA